MSYSLLLPAKLLPVVAAHAALAGPAAAAPWPAASCSVPTSLAMAPAYQPGADPRTGLLLLAPLLSRLTAAPKLQGDAHLKDLGDQVLREATQLEQADPKATLRPLMLAGATLLLAIQQKAYPSLAAPAQALLRQAQALPGHNNTPAEQTRNYQFVQQESALFKQLLALTPGTHP